jgi:amino acid adenylation domain-containing protein/non-ribosomal peptide synthase protein (TIGR01720 family)
MLSAFVTPTTTIGDIEDRLHDRQPLPKQPVYSSKAILLLHHNSQSIKTDEEASELCGLFGLRIHYSVSQDVLRLSLSFDANISGAASVYRIATQLRHFVDQITHKSLPTVLCRLDLISPDDLHDIWNQNTTIHQRFDACVHDLIKETAQLHPETQAICAWDGTLTYKELDHSSTKLAKYLVSLGVTVGMVIPLCFEKSMWVPVAILGVMKAGAASVVFDATLPEERLRTITQQVDAKIMLASMKCRDLASRLDSSTVVCISKQQIEAIGGMESTPLPKVQPSDKLYVVFTSGSTGTPKGAIVTHANFSNAFALQLHALGFRRTSRVYDFASYAFDISWSNILHTLRAGGCLCIPSEGDRQNNIAQSVSNLEANFANLTPTVARLLDPAEVPTLQTLLLSGEAMSASDAHKWRHIETLLSTYGQAETTVKMAVQNVRPEEDGYLALGRPVGTNAWIVNPHDYTQLVPFGCTGELLAEGPFVGAGYFNDVKRTTAAFIEDPQWLLHGGPETPGRHGRLYRTSDLVRYREDGRLEFVGRKEGYAKIHGQRIDLGEVEHHIQLLLNRDDARAQAIAEVTNASDDHSAKLVAFIIPDEPLNRNENQLISWVSELTANFAQELANSLPYSMIPAIYIPLETIPMGLTGKSDRRKLREIGSAFRQLEPCNSVYPLVVPEGFIETVLRDVWAHTLNIPAESVSVDSLFARLGGDSITAMQVTSRCRAQKIGVKVADTLRLQTIRKIAPRCTMLEQRHSADDDIENGDIWSLSPMQQTMLDANPTHNNHYNQSFILRVSKPEALHVFQSAVSAVVRRHAMLRVRIRRDEHDQWGQQVMPFDTTKIACELRIVSGMDEVEHLSQLRQRQLDIAQGRVFTVDIFEDHQDGSQTILLSAHHLVVDLVSWRIIWYDLQRALEGLPLERPSMSFRKWCQIQQHETEFLQPERLLPFVLKPSNSEYWGLKPGNNFTKDRRIHYCRLNKKTTSLLLGESNERFHTETIDILVAMLQHSFETTFTDREPPTIYLEGHGREQIIGTELDISDTVGWFTTIYPLELSFAADDGRTTMVKIVKNIRRQIPGNGRPYFAARSQKQTVDPQVQDIEILFNYHGQFQQLEHGISKFYKLKKPIQLEQAAGNTRREGLIEVTVDVTQGEMQLQMVVNQTSKHQERLKEWAKAYETALNDISLELLHAPIQITASDFPLLNISPSGLEALIKDQFVPMGVAIDDIADIYPCSPLQEGLRLSKSRGAASYVNNLIWSCSASTRGAMDGISVQRLDRAWKATINRHSVFRTIFTQHPESGRIVQVLMKEATPLRVRLVKSGGASTTEFLKNVDTPTFDVNVSEYQVTICSADNGEVACRLDMSHSLSDLTSATIIARDVITAYDTEVLPPAPQFKDAIQKIYETPMEDKFKYWTAMLKGIKPCHFPTSQLIAPEGGKSHGSLSVSLGKSTTVDDFCKAKCITRSVFMQTAWGMVLSRWLGIDRPCFGYLASGRDLHIDNINDIVGPLVTMLVGQMNTSSTLSETFDAVSQYSTQSFDFQHVSLADIQHRLGADGRALFNTVITVYNAPNKQLSNEGLKLKQCAGDDPHEVSVDSISSARCDLMCF